MKARASRAASLPINSMPPEAVPMVVCMTFSVELYLKCLVWLETGKAPRGHNLEQLMALVSQPIRDRVKHHYDDFIDQGPYKSGFTGPGVQPDAAVFDVALKVASDGFVSWRYVYEQDMAHGLNLAMYFAYAVRRTIIEVRPDFEQMTSGLSMPPTSLTR